VCGRVEAGVVEARVVVSEAGVRLVNMRLQASDGVDLPVSVCRLRMSSVPGEAETHDASTATAATTPEHFMVGYGTMYFALMPGRSA